MNQVINIAVIFFILQLINVILNTAKTLIMTRTDNPHLSALINAITYGFYTAVVKQIATLDLSITIAIVIATNVVGVYFTYWLKTKFKKDNLWKVEIYVPSDIGQTLLTKTFEKANISHVLTAPNFITAYCYTQQESAIVNKTIKMIGVENNIKYNITEITKRF